VQQQGAHDPVGRGAADGDRAALEEEVERPLARTPGVELDGVVGRRRRVVDEQGFERRTQPAERLVGVGPDADVEVRDPDGERARPT
jgi:hypothetical protein